MGAGCLYVVATPIGNLEDISAHALRVLREVDLIAAEDTRRSKKLLSHYDIKTPLTSYHDHNETAKAEVLLGELDGGRNVALMADAGTPCVSDPGYRVVRAAHERGIRVASVPGPSALVAALAVSGLPSDRFTFHGFFPRKQGDANKVLVRIAGSGGTHLFFEAPRRLVRTLDRIATAISEAEVCVTRELTKMFEEVFVGSPREVCEHFAAAPVRGECVVILHTSAHAEVVPTAAELLDRVDAAMESEGLSRRDAIRRVAAELNLPRKQVYAAAKEVPW